MKFQQITAKCQDLAQAAAMSVKFILMTCVFALCAQGSAETLAVVERLPSETIVLKAPNNCYANWKEIARYVIEKEGLVEYIPPDQNSTNWSELIAIQYFDRSSTTWKANNIENTMALIQETTLAPHLGKKMTFKIIETNKSDAIYEWMAQPLCEEIALEHEVSRIFLTETRLHRICFSCKHRDMSSEKREQYIKLLRETSLVSIEEAQRIPHALSILDRVKGSLNLGKTFRNWQVVHDYTLENGCAIVTTAPPTLKGKYISECLEVTTLPIVRDGVAIDQFYETEKEGIQQKSSEAIKFSILKRSANDIIYSFVYPQDNLQVTGVTRSFIANQSYYSICYKRGLPKELHPGRIQQWKERLEAIKLRD